LREKAVLNNVNIPESLGAPFSVVRTLPTVTKEGIEHLPFLFLDQDGDNVRWHWEALVYARSARIGYNLATVEHDLEAVGRFFDFYRVFWLKGALPEEDFDYLIYAYLVWRHRGTMQNGVSVLEGLRWKALAFNALRSEFRSLVRYCHFSSRTWGHVSLGRFRQQLDPDGIALVRMRNLSKVHERDFLVHLAASRNRWALEFGIINAEMPRVAMPERGASKAGLSVMNDEQVWAIINAEKNPIFRALWLVGAFGGIRISEQLNAWQSDILPGSYRKLAFGYDDGGEILFLRAHPVRSRYLGDLGKPGDTRKQYLHKEYSLLPRNALGRRDPLYAGWKGTLSINSEFDFSEVFWLDQRAVALFAECAREIREFHRVHKSSGRHPYFYVNTADPTSEYRGAPLKMSNVEAAFERACRRCGLEPHRWGIRIHGPRHYYKNYAKSLGIAPDHIQIMMGHSRVEAQEDYGRGAREVAKRLSEARQQRQGITEGQS
jgi:hypothetical protein